MMLVSRCNCTCHSLILKATNRTSYCGSTCSCVELLVVVIKVMKLRMSVQHEEVYVHTRYKSTHSSCIRIHNINQVSGIQTVSNHGRGFNYTISRNEPLSKAQA